MVGISKNLKSELIWLIRNHRCYNFGVFQKLGNVGINLLLYFVFTKVTH